MRFRLLGNMYDDDGDERAKTFFQKVGRWIQEASRKNKAEWHRILSTQYEQYLVGSADSGGNTLLESCQGCSGNCGNCYIKNDIKGEGSMDMLDQQIIDAFGEKEKLESEDDSGFEMVQRITKDGKLEQTEASKRDEKSYWQEKKGKKETIEESDDLSDDEKILAAFK